MQIPNPPELESEVMENLLVDGELWEYSEHVEKWSKRYYLLCYKSPPGVHELHKSSSGRACGSQSFRKFVICANTAIIHPLANNYGREDSFQLNTPQQILTLATTTTHERKAWVSQIQTAIRRAEQERAKPPDISRVSSSPGKIIRFRSRPRSSSHGSEPKFNIQRKGISRPHPDEFNPHGDGPLPENEIAAVESPRTRSKSSGVMRHRSTSGTRRTPELGSRRRLNTADSGSFRKSRRKVKLKVSTLPGHLKISAMRPAAERKVVPPRSVPLPARIGKDSEHSLIQAKPTFAAVRKISSSPSTPNSTSLPTTPVQRSRSPPPAPKPKPPPPTYPPPVRVPSLRMSSSYNSAPPSPSYRSSSTKSVGAGERVFTFNVSPTSRATSRSTSSAPPSPRNNNVKKKCIKFRKAPSSISRSHTSPKPDSTAKKSTSPIVKLKLRSQSTGHNPDWDKLLELFDKIKLDRSHAEPFLKEGITVDDLPYLTDSDIKELIPQKGPRSRLRRYILEQKFG